MHSPLVQWPTKSATHSPLVQWPHGAPYPQPCIPGTPCFGCSRPRLNAFMAPGMRFSHHMRSGISLSRSRGAKLSSFALSCPISLWRGTKRGSEHHTMSSTTRLWLKGWLRGWWSGLLHILTTRAQVVLVGIELPQPPVGNNVWAATYGDVSWPNTGESPHPTPPPPCQRVGGPNLGEEGISGSGAKTQSIDRLFKKLTCTHLFSVRKTSMFQLVGVPLVSRRSGLVLALA